MTDPGPADPLPFPHFYSPPLAGRDDILVEVYECFEISTHTPLAGRDPVPQCAMYICRTFLLTRPLRDVTEDPEMTNISASFLLTRPLRDVTFE